MALVRLGQLLPEVHAKAVLLILTAAHEGIALRVSQAYRSYAAQAKLYAQGRTAPGNIVTNAKPGQSWHQFRRAFDVVIMAFPGDKTISDLYDGPWDRLGELGESLGLEWGGRWASPDRPHFQDRGGMTLAQAQAAEDGT